MGSQAKQAALWGKNPADWASIQERTCIAGYEYALGILKLKPDETLLDIGCGSGFFCQLAHQAGAHVTGFDATAGLVEQARLRVPQVTFYVGDMEALPFGDDAFDVVTAFNSFQFAENTANALKEARRVLKPAGRLTAMIWGNPEDCEAASFLKAVGSLMPPQPPGTGGPFALTENHLLEDAIIGAGLRIVDSNDVASAWVYADKESALKGLCSAGPAAAAAAHNGAENVIRAIAEAIVPYVQPDGSVVYQNKFRVVTALKDE